MLDIYNQDRKATVESFRCYWQIDYMISNKEFGLFPIVEDIKIQVEEKKEEDDDNLGG